MDHDPLAYVKDGSRVFHWSRACAEADRGQRPSNDHPRRRRGLIVLRKSALFALMEEDVLLPCRICGHKEPVPIP